MVFIYAKRVKLVVWLMHLCVFGALVAGG
jgi:hypothetical protein